MIEEGVRFGLPVVGGATLLYLLFGVLARVAPQIQIFQIAYSVTILGGFSSSTLRSLSSRRWWRASAVSPGRPCVVGPLSEWSG